MKAPNLRSSKNKNLACKQDNEFGSFRLRTAKTLVDWALKVFMPSRTIAADALATFWKKASEVERGRGTKGLILFCKEGRSILLRSLSSPDLFPVRGMRRRLYPYFGKSLVGKAPSEFSSVDLRVLLTALSTTRAWYLPPEISIETITSPGVIPV